MSAMVLPRLAVVAVGDERHGSYGRRMRRAANDDVQRRADSGGWRIDIAHRDGAADARAEGAAGDAADGRAVLLLDLAALAGRRAAFELQPHAAAAGAFRDLALDAVGAGEASALAAALADGPDQV